MVSKSINPIPLVSEATAIWLSLWIQIVKISIHYVLLMAVYNFSFILFIMFNDQGFDQGIRRTVLVEYTYNTYIIDIVIWNRSFDFLPATTSCVLNFL